MTLDRIHIKSSKFVQQIVFGTKLVSLEIYENSPY
jgi:hypothetical protein